MGPTMNLSPEPSYPSTHRYVLKLHRDCEPARGCLIGRLENIISGHHFHFSTVDELMAGIARDLQSATAAGEH
jgi:hypothetical protein